MRQRNVLDAVVRHALSAADPGGEFHDVSSGYDFTAQHDMAPLPIGFTLD